MPAYSLRSAFPCALAHLAEEAERQLAGYALQPDTNIFTASVQNETLRIPYRIYQPYSEAYLRTATEDLRLLFLCIYSRHHNGFIREMCVRRLLARPAIPYYSIPFLLKGAEEYVIEIIRVLRDGWHLIPSHYLISFIDENPKWLSLMQSRQASYWDIYYRHRYPRLSLYPGTLILEAMQLLAKAPRQSIKTSLDPFSSLPHLD